ncbi:MAG TPA: Ldh family oxidoreductase [Chloroflexota bacterium]|jgi:LDH2 family malate/lactate/ureidoglycolate dehydrogenase
MLTIDSQRLRAVATAIFRGLGTPDDVTDETVEILIASNLAGHDSHGVQLIPNYARQVEQGRVVPSARPEIVEESATTALVAGRWGWGQYTAAWGTNVALRKARESKIAVVALVECNHVGRLGEYSERAARDGLGLVATLGSAEKRGSTAPFGGRRGVLGTNPWSMALPAGRRRHVLLDFATTVIAGNKVAVARAKGEPLPPGAVLDREGRPSTNPDDLRDGGVMLPFGGHKGYALSVFAELMGNVVAPSYRFRGPGRWGGTLLIAFDPAMFAPRPEYEAAVDDVLDRLKAVEPAPGFEEVLVPGEPESRSRRRRSAEGVPVPEATWQALVETGRKLELDVEAVSA